MKLEGSLKKWGWLRKGNGVMELKVKVAESKVVVSDGV